MKNQSTNKRGLRTNLKAKPSLSHSRAINNIFGNISSRKGVNNSQGDATSNREATKVEQEYNGQDFPKPLSVIQSTPKPEDATDSSET